MNAQRRAARKAAAAQSRPRPALSPRVPPTRLESGTYGTAGRASDRSEFDPTAGAHGATGERRTMHVNGQGRTRTRVARENTMRTARMGGTAASYRPRAVDLAGRDDIDNGTRVTAPRVTVASPGRKPSPSRKEAGTASAGEGIRQAAMRERSLRVQLGIPDYLTVAQWHQLTADQQHRRPARRLPL